MQTEESLASRALKNAVALLLGLVFAFVVLEIVFRLLPTRDATGMEPVTAASPYAHYPPGQTLRISIGRFFEIRTTKALNNHGFFSDVAFRSDDPAGKIVVIGDSYVEAFQVPNAESIHGLLDARFAPARRVYGIGVSGSSLAQYLAYAEYAKANFDPEAFVFVIIGNDFDEAILENDATPGYHYFAIEDGKPRKVLVEYQPSALKTLARRSALVRYVALNLNIAQIVAGLTAGDAVAYVGNTERTASARKLALSRAGVDFFLDEIRRVAAGRPVVFAIDGYRQQIYAERPIAEIADSFVFRMNEYFRRASERKGFHPIELHPAFERHYQAHRQHFEWPIDWHWNALGHRIAADEVEKALNPLLGGR